MKCDFYHCRFELNEVFYYRKIILHLIACLHISKKDDDSYSPWNTHHTNPPPPPRHTPSLPSPYLSGFDRKCLVGSLHFISLHFIWFRWICVKLKEPFRSACTLRFMFMGEHKLSMMPLFILVAFLFPLSSFQWGLNKFPKNLCRRFLCQRINVRD